jgi:hypothetical protein
MDAPPQTDAAATLATSPFLATRALIFVKTMTKGIGVVTMENIEAGTLLGYYTGRIVSNAPSAGLSSAYVLDVAPPDAPKNAPPLFSIDASAADIDPTIQPLVLPHLGLAFTTNEQQTSWTRYINSVNPEDSRYSQNVDFVYDVATNRIRVVTRRKIYASEELLTEYGEGFFYARLQDVQYRIESAASAWTIITAIDDERRADESVLQRVYDTSTYTTFSLRDRGGDVIGVAVFFDTTVTDIYVVPFRNRLAAAYLMLSRIYTRAVLTESEYMFATDAVFSDPKTAESFYFSELITEDAASYVRSVGLVEVKLANSADLVILPRMGQNIACPELFQRFTYPDARVRSDGTRYDSDFSPPEKAVLKLHVAAQGGLYAGASVEARVRGMLYLQYVCAFQPYGPDDELQAYVLESLIVAYEKRCGAGAMMYRVHVSSSMKDLMSTRTHLLQYRTASKKKMYLSRVDDTVYYERNVAGAPSGR